MLVRNAMEAARLHSPSAKFFARSAREDQLNARLNACAKRSRSAATFVSVAPTSSAFPSREYSSLSAKPAMMSSSFASRSTT